MLESCDLVYVLAEGQVLASGTPNEVASNPEVRSRYLGTRTSYLTASDRGRQREDGDARPGARGSGPRPAAATGARHRPPSGHSADWRACGLSTGQPEVKAVVPSTNCRPLMPECCWA